MRQLCFLTILSILFAYVEPDQARADSQTNLDLIKDAAGMFNERGYLKSNSFSQDGSEIINDFNGNLVYVQRLDYQPLSQAGIHFDLKICYNGSVGHTSNSGLRRITAGTGDKMNALNLPEWIISVNDIAIQTFNFENDPISWASGLTEEDSISECNDVSALINGYHSCYKYNNTTANGIRYGTISVLMGDGGVKELISLDSGLYGATNRYFYGFVFEGEYRTMSKDDRSRGYVNATDSTFTLFLDDGTRVIFKFYRPIWKTTITDSRMTEPGDSLIMLLPVAFVDQMGNNVGVSYNYHMADDETPVYGRPLARSAGDWSFGWGYLLNLSTASQMTLTNYDKEYVIAYGHQGDTASQPSIYGESNRAYVSSITDPADRRTSFSYGAYHLRGKRCRYSTIDIECHDASRIYYRHAATTVLFNPARIDSIYYPDGGRSSYCYFGDWQDTMTVDYSSYLCEAGNVPARPCIKSEYFNSLGRDPYFINMVIKRIRMNNGDNGTVNVSKDSLVFSWVDHDPFEEISALDTFFMTRLVGKSSFGNFPQEQVKRFEYMYKQHQEDGTYSDLERDRGWVVKLHQKKESKNGVEGGAVINTILNWDTRVNGTFQLISQTITKDNVTTTTAYEYQWYNNGETNPLISNIIKHTVTDPWGIRTEAYFHPRYFNISGTGSYYANTLVDSTKRCTPDSVLMEQTAQTFYDSLSSKGFPGQTQAVKKYFVESGQVVDSVTERHEYFRGNNIYAPYNNGLLRKITTASGDSVIYHYRELFANSQEYGTVKRPPDSSLCTVTYYGLRFDGTIDTVDGDFINPEPFWFKSLTYTADGNDSIEFWQSVDNRGNIKKTVGPNRFLSEFAYDKISRLSTALLPGDFVPSDYYDTTYYLSEPRLNSGYPVTDGEFRYWKYDSVWATSNIFNCSKDTLWGADSLSYAKKDTAADHIRQAVYLEYFNIAPADSAIIDSAVLYVYGVKAGVGEIALMTQQRCLCNHDSPAWHDSVGQAVTIKLGENRFVLNHYHPSIALLAKEMMEPMSFALLSSECSDPTKRPRLEIYYRQMYSVYNNPIYALHYDYDDDTTGGTGITTTVLPDIDHYPITNRLHFDGYGRVIQRDAVDSNQFSDSTRTAYDYADRVASQIDQLGNATSFAYDVFDRRVKTIYPDSVHSSDSTAFSYGDAHTLGLDTLSSMRHTGLYRSHTLDENGHRITEYADVLGRLRLRETLPQDGTICKTYFDYDDNGNLTMVIKPNGDRVNYRYNSLGWLTKEWAADYDTINRVYDKNGRQVLYRDGGIKALDDQTSDPPHHWMFTKYDPLDRTTETGLLAVGTDTLFRTPINRFFYDQYGSSNSRGRLSLTYSDSEGYGYGEKYDYDARGRIEGQTCYYHPVLDSTFCDSVSVRRTRTVGTDSVIMVMEKSGDVYYSLERLNTLSLLTFAAISKRVAGQDSLIAVTYNVDQNANGLCDTIADRIPCNAGDTIRLSVQINDYDFDRQYSQLYAMASYVKYPVSQKYLRDPHVAYHLGFTYDLTDNLTSITYPDGMVVTYGYDDRGRLAAVGDTMHSDKYARILYTARNEVRQVILGDSLQSVDYAYNARGWLNTINNGASASAAPGDLFGQRLYYYGCQNHAGWQAYFNGNIMAQDISLTGAANTYHYDYDDCDRLAGVHVYTGALGMPDMHEHFYYDRNGNMTGLRRGGDSLTFLYTAGDNLLDSVQYRTSANRRHYTYDKNGSLTGDNFRNADFRYDIYGQLDTAIFPGATDTSLIAFGYNTDGRRVYKDYYYTYLDSCNNWDDPSRLSAVGARGKSAKVLADARSERATAGGGGGDLCVFHARTLTRYVREKAGGKVLAEYGSDVGAGPDFKYIYAGNQRIAMYDKTGKLHFFLSDHLGSTRLVIDSAGVVKDKYSRYFAYGGGESQTISTGQKYRYTGQPYDDDGAFDLYYYGARYYDPVIGRFISRDPMAQKYPAWSPFAYTLDNPIKSIDPNGKWVETLLDVGSVVMSAKDLWNEPSWANAGWLTLDVVGAAVPFIPAVGIVRHAAKAERLAKNVAAGKAAENAVEAGLKESGEAFSKQVVKGSSRIDFVVHGKGFVEVKGINWAAESYKKASNVSSRLGDIGDRLNKYSKLLQENECLTLVIPEPEDAKIVDRLQKLAKEFNANLQWAK